MHMENFSVEAKSVPYLQYICLIIYAQTMIFIL